MLLQSCRRLFLSKVLKVSKPPVTGYEIAELPNEKVLHDFMTFYRTKGVVVILHSGTVHASPAASSSGVASSTVSGTRRDTATKPKTHLQQDPLTRSFISSLNAMNLGHPDEVKLALVPGPQAPRFVDEYNIITFPTSLLFLNGQCVYRVTGARSRELSIKSLFMLRNGGRNIFSRE
ncbi:hypothetical protein NESM_000565600 [Novymonas esmeraldas]|uniref:Uncharacterized protein n=1 Tax=Novymonas esmeraldas TaxID=1808958 RepID=A0AAW0ETC8_9TRYP